MRVLLAENDPRAVIQISTALEVLDYALDIVDESELAQEALRTKDFDIIILGSNLKKPTPSEIMVEYIKRGGVSPFIFLVPKENFDDGVAALDAGADDFILKPIHVHELVARVRAIARRNKNYTNPMMEFGPLTFDFDSRSVWLEGELLALTRRDKAVLEVLLKRAGKYATKEYIASYLYTINVDVNIRTIETYIYRLRTKINHPAINIKTVWGSGYTIELKEYKSSKNMTKKSQELKLADNVIARIG